MVTKRVVILANSIKKAPARCLAGREFLEDGAVGDWIRPVTASGEGELQARHYRLDNGRAAQVLDVVDVLLLRADPTPGQPENWLLDESRSWIKRAEFERRKLPELVEAPVSLWLEPGGRTDRITPAAQAALKPQRSLVLIAPQAFRVEAWREFNNFKGYKVRKSRAIFTYAGTEYHLSITDPEFRPPLRFPEGAPFVLEFPNPQDLLLCVSLAPPFQGFQYKIVATVFGSE